MATYQVDEPTSVNATPSISLPINVQYAAGVVTPSEVAGSVGLSAGGTTGQLYPR